MTYLYHKLEIIHNYIVKMDLVFFKSIFVLHCKWMIVFQYDADCKLLLRKDKKEINYLNEEIRFDHKKKIL